MRRWQAPAVVKDPGRAAESSGRNPGSVCPDGGRTVVEPSGRRAAGPALPCARPAARLASGLRCTRRMSDFVPEESSAFENEAILPVQFEDLVRSEARPPEHRLLFAVLEDAVRCWQLYASSTSPTGQEIFREADEWFASSDDSSPFTFVAICQLFGLDPDYIRMGLRRWRERQRATGSKVVPFRIRRVGGTRHMVGGHEPRKATVARREQRQRAVGGQEQRRRAVG